jgi:hypothetical protein
MREQNLIKLPEVLLIGVGMLIYVIVLVLIFRKLIDIIEHEAKYNRIRDFQRYQKSFWFEPLAYYHKKFFSKNYLSTLVVLLILEIPILAIIYFGSIWIQQILFKPSEIVVFFQPDSYSIGLIATLVLSFFLTTFICFASDRPLLVAASLNLFSNKKRVDDWLKTIIGLFISFLIAFPLLVLSIDNYVYLSDSEIVLNPYQNIGEMHISFDQISAVKTVYSREDSHSSSYRFEYDIYLADGRSINIGDGGIKAISFIHQRLSNQSIKFEKTQMSKTDLAKIKTLYGDSTTETIKEIFIIQ